MNKLQQIYKQNILIPLRSGVRIGANSSITINFTSQDAARFGCQLKQDGCPFGCNSAHHHSFTTVV